MKGEGIEKGLVDVLGRNVALVVELVLGVDRIRLLTLDVAHQHVWPYARVCASGHRVDDDRAGRALPVDAEGCPARRVLQRLSDEAFEENVHVQEECLGPWSAWCVEVVDAMLGEQETRPDVPHGVVLVPARVLHRLRGVSGTPSHRAEFLERRCEPPDAGLDCGVGTDARRDRKACGEDPVLGDVGLELIEPALDLIDLVVVPPYLAVYEQPAAECREPLVVLDVVLQHALADDHLGLVRQEQAHEVE
jgi:hypothetical protein